MFDLFALFVGCEQELVTFPFGVLPLASVVDDSKHHDEVGIYTEAKKLRKNIRSP